MTPGEINRLIAEKCCKWHLVGKRWYDENNKELPFVDQQWSELYFDPNHNRDHAMMALEKFERWLIQRTGYYKCLIELGNNRIAFSGKENTPSAAISEALVEAVKEKE